MPGSAHGDAEPAAEITEIRAGGTIPEGLAMIDRQTEETGSIGDGRIQTSGLSPLPSTRTTRTSMASRSSRTRGLPVSMKRGGDHAPNHRQRASRSVGGADQDYS